MYKVEAIPGAGLGTIATSFIPLGTLIIAESPLFILDKSGGVNDALLIVQHKIESLSADQQQAFYSLHNAYESRPLELGSIETWPLEFGIIKTNSLPLGNEATQVGVFPECSRLNHNCNPNGNHTWNSTLSKEFIYAIKDILPGEQITLSYLPSPYLPRSERRGILFKGFFFNCTCSTCERPPEEISASDKRRMEVDILTDSVFENDLIGVGPAIALECCKEALKLLKDEGMEIPGRYTVYNCALQICVQHGDLARASAFAELVKREIEVAEGKDSTDLKEAKPYIKHPEKHPRARIPNKKIWRTRVKDKRTVGSDGFEEWLWGRLV